MSTDQQLDEAECTRRGVIIQKLEAEIARLKGKCSRQRRELHRLNKTLKALWAGARFHINTMATMREQARKGI